MPAPKLSEILRGADPELGSGTPAVVIDQSNLVRTLNENAEFKARNDWNKYNSFLNNLNGIYKDLGDVAALEVAAQDRDQLQKEAGDIYKQIMDNPREVFGGGAGMAAVQQKLGQLRSKSVESKLNRAYDFAHREYINRNPELNVEENKTKINSYLQQPLGKREPYMLDMPVMFNAGEFAKELMANPAIQQKFAETSLVNEKKEPGNEFIREVEGTQIKKEPFMKAWMAGYNTKQDKFGHSIRKAVDQQFNSLPDTLKKRVGSAENYYKLLGEAQFNSDKDIVSLSKDNLQPNPNAYKAIELANAKERLSQGWASIDVARKRLDKEDEEDIYGADTVLNEGIAILDNGTPQVIENYKNSGKPKEVLLISDPLLLKEFAAIDKDGKTTNVPDEIQYDKDKGELNLVYFDKDFKGNIKTTKSGKRVIKDTKGLNERTWLKQKTKQSFPNKNIGTINSLVDDVLTKEGNNLFKLAQKRKGQQVAPPSQSQKKFDISKYSLVQMKAAADKSGMTVEEWKAAVENYNKTGQ